MTLNCFASLDRYIMEFLQYYGFALDIFAMLVVYVEPSTLAESVGYYSLLELFSAKLQRIKYENDKLSYLPQFFAYGYCSCVILLIFLHILQRIFRYVAAALQYCGVGCGKWT